MVDTKACEQCGVEFARKPRRSAAQWANVRFCSRSCAVRGGRWNGGSRPEPATCENCGKSFAVKERKRANRFCSQGCYWDFRRSHPRPHLVKGGWCVRAPEHPLAPPSGVLSTARIALYEKIGPGEHPCNWCGEPVRWIVGGTVGTPGSLLADHLDWDRANDDPANLVPSCHRCNSTRTRAGDRRRLTDDDLTILWSGRRTRAIERTCETCESIFLTVPAEVKNGRGRFCSRSCARRAPRARA